MCHEEVAANGWSTMLANAGAIFGDQLYINKPESLAINDINFLFDDSTVTETLKYVKETLHPETLNHSMRVFFYGMPACYVCSNNAEAGFKCLLRNGHHEATVPQAGC